MKNFVNSKLFGGVVLCLTMLFASCGNADNALEEIINGGGNTSPLATPLTLEATTAGTIVVNKPQTGMQYSLNGGAKTTLTADPTNITVAAGDKLAFYGKGTTITAYCSDGSDNTNIQGSGSGFTFKVYGNIMSLIDETGFATATTLSERWAFTGLFSDNVSLTDASGLQLPATTLAKDSYHRMFMGCSNLTAAPSKLPATTVTASCYAQMFEDCKSLTSAPELPATKLDSYCYSSMFRGCTSLTTAPALPATTLAGLCYQSMFNGCTSLTTAPELPAETMENSCYYDMFNGCKALTTAPALPATTLADYCYTAMFANCLNLTTASALPATTLARNCYHSMFSNCPNLTTAPVLSASTLVIECYAFMFNGCSKLGSVTCKATSGFDAETPLYQWLDGAGTSATEPRLYVVSSMTGAEWNKGCFTVTALP